MGGSPEWDNRMMDSLKNFDLSSPDIKQQFGEFYFGLSLAVYASYRKPNIELIILNFSLFAVR